uniref:Uncharacterized protein n=1 Tax=Desertifilum tharense IPPAS B-1220 TaxID=1781255 RepID=A0A1E5QPJ9_9CYAN|nr:hypothetical protein BH720_04120 [Desertifilum tharense IPPAS B-1220]
MLLEVRFTIGISAEPDNFRHLASLSSTIDRTLREWVPPPVFNLTNSYGSGLEKQDDFTESSKMSRSRMPQALLAPVETGL